MDYFESLAQTGRIVLRLVATLQDKLFIEELAYQEKDCKDMTRVYPIFVESRAKRLELGASALKNNRELLSSIIISISTN